MRMSSVKAKAGQAARRGGDRRRVKRSVRARFVLAVLTALGGSARGAGWDPVPGTGPGDGFVSGGSGIWDLAGLNWTAEGGFSNLAWVNGDAAVFGGNSG